MEELFDIYFEELKEMLIEFNDILMKSQGKGINADVLNSIFRIAHTVKGNSAGMEFFNIEKVMHHVEDILQQIREGKRELTEDVLKLLFKCHDFLEDAVGVIEKTRSDKTIDISAMLANVDEILGKSQKKEKPAETTPKKITKEKKENKSKKGINDFQLPKIDTELIAVMIDNCKRGMKAYRIIIELSPVCQMKNVRVWMLFEEIDQYANFVFSKPERPEPDQFRNEEYEFEGDVMEVYSITDKDIKDLEGAVLGMTDVISVKIDNLEIEWLENEKDRLQNETKVLRLIKDVEVNLLDMEKREINKERLKNTQTILTKIVNLGEESLDEYIIKTTNNVLLLMKYFEENQSEVENNDIEVIAFLMNKIQNLIQDNRLLDDYKFKEEIDNILHASHNKFAEAKPKIGEVLSKSNVMNNSDVQDILTSQKEKYPDLKFGQVAVKEDKASAYDMMKAIKVQTVTKDEIKENAFIRVPINKVDGLMDMLSELLILNAQMEQKVQELEGTDSGLNNVLSRSAKLIRGIQGLSMSLRMVEIKPILHRLTRIARDTATELDKKITVNIEGEDTEIDRSASEKLFDPMMHLVRNAVSHGIETEKERIKLGKSPEGNINIRVYSKRGNVYIEVEDDGKGINLEAVYQKAKKQGLAIEGKEYTEDEILKFIFHPGFSLQEVVNTISGRGVGMNVVESEINKMGGKVEIINKEGHGAIFVVRIPMNLAVVNGTIVEVSGGRYILPTLFIKEFFIPQKENWVFMQGKNKAIKVRDNIIPIITEKDVFGENNSTVKTEDKNVIILEMDQKYLAFPVDKIVSRQEIVSKPLDKEFSGVGFAAGASILGDGNISVILDVEAMFKMGSHMKS